MILVSDVTRLYESETKIISQVIKRNIDSFRENFRFQLKQEKYISIRPQFVSLRESEGFIYKFLKVLYKHLRHIG